MNSSENKLTFWNFAFLWCGAAISIAEILTGGFMAPLGFKIGLIAILLGHLIGTTVFVLGGIIGIREEIPAITSTRMSFGLYGTYLFSVLNILQLVGWTAVMIKAAAQSLNLITASIWSFNNITIWSIVIGVLTALWIAFGMTGFKKINTIAVLLLFILTLVLGWIIFRSGKLFSAPSGNGISFGGALELAVVMPISWLPLIADYTRFARDEKEGAYGSFWGYFIGSSWMFIIGLGAGIISKNPDPSAMMLAANLGIAAFGIVVLSTVTTTFMDAYSAGVTFLNIAPKLSEKTTAIIMTIIGTLISLVFHIDNYTNFLYAIGSVFSPLFAIVITDYFVIKKQTKIEEGMLLNIGAVIIWAIGVALYYIFIKIDFILGATAPSMIITGILYFIGWRYINTWRLMKRSKNSYAK